MNLHQSLRDARNDSQEFREWFKAYQHKYALTE